MNLTRFQHDTIDEYYRPLITVTIVESIINDLNTRHLQIETST